MPPKSSTKAAHGEKMIQLTIRLWTNNLADSKGSIRPKHAWSSGVVKLERNPAHGIKSGRPIVFRSIPELAVAFETCLIAGSIRLHPSAKTSRYSAADDE